MLNLPVVGPHPISDVKVHTDFSEFDWTIENFSRSDAVTGLKSSVFTAVGADWQLHLYPKGQFMDKKYLSLFLWSIDNKEDADVRLAMLLEDQIDDDMLTKSQEFEHIYPANKTEMWGWSAFKDFEEFYMASNGYLVKDCVKFHGTITRFWRKDPEVDDGSGDDVEGYRSLSLFPGEAPSWGVAAVVV